MNTSTSIKSYEFTRRAMSRFEAHLQTIHAGDSNALYHFLSDELKNIPVCDYLKRYLYVNAQIQDPFEQVCDESYARIIRQSFLEHHTPFTTKPDSVKKPGAIIRDWLCRTKIKRDTAFLLGFGLGMTAEDMSDFLMKSIKEIDFDFMNPLEVIYWHCFRTGKDYYEMLQLKRRMECLNSDRELRKSSFYESVACNPEGYLFDEVMLEEYLIWLNQSRQCKSSQAREQFELLFERLKGARQETGNSFVEQYYYCGIPSGKNGNLVRAACSALSEKIGSYRLTRQRISGIRQGKLAVSRNDLITMLFFCYCDAYTGCDGRELVNRFLEECNQLLMACQMYSLYVASPYEAFILVCLMSEYPLDMFSEIWEISLQKS